MNIYLKNKITNRQLFFILLLTLASFSVINISKVMVENAGTGGWIPVLITTIFFAFVASIIVKLNIMHKNKMLYDYSKDLVGRVFTYIILLYYFIYFTLILVFTVINQSIILQANFLQKTPIWASILIGIPVFCFIAYKGINTIARMVEFFGVVYLITAISVHILMFSQGKIERILPIFNPAEVKKYLAAIKYAIFPFMGAEVLLFIPLNKRNGKKAVKTAFLTMITIGIFYIIIIQSCVMKVGLNDIVHYKDSLIVAIRYLEIPMLDFLKRMDFLFLTVGFTGIFMGISMLYTVLTELLSKIFVKINRLVIVIFLAVFSYLLCLFVNTFFLEYSKFIKNIGALLGLIAGVFIPTVLLIISKVKKNEA